MSDSFLAFIVTGFITAIFLLGLGAGYALARAWQERRADLLAEKFTIVEWQAREAVRQLHQARSGERA
jgi:uncharacterized membrane protein